MEPPPAPANDSAASLSATTVAGGSFLQLNYSWTYEGEEQTGVLFFGYDEENAASAAWVDSFHMSNKIMFCTGTAADGTVTVRGSYAAPPGPDWGWSMAIRSVSADEFQIVMHNISPEGEESLAVQAEFTRSA
jgi:hypothetical protein